MLNFEASAFPVICSTWLAPPMVRAIHRPTWCWDPWKGKQGTVQQPYQHLKRSRPVLEKKELTFMKGPPHVSHRTLDVAGTYTSLYLHICRVRITASQGCQN